MKASCSGAQAVAPKDSKLAKGPWFHWPQPLIDTCVLITTHANTKIHVHLRIHMHLQLHIHTGIPHFHCEPFAHTGPFWRATSPRLRPGAAAAVGALQRQQGPCGGGCLGLPRLCDALQLRRAASASERWIW